MEAFSLQKVAETLEEVVVIWREVRWIWWLRQNFIAQFVQLLKCWYAMCGYCPGKYLGPFCWPLLAVGIAVFSASHWFPKHTPQMWWFHWDSESLVDRWAADHQTATIFWCRFGFGKRFGASSGSNHLVGCHQFYKTYFSLHITVIKRNGSLLLHRREKVTSKWQYFWFPVNSWSTHLLSLPSLLQMPNDHRMVDGEFFVSFSG